jgi:hypothetical protein
MIGCILPNPCALAARAAEPIPRRVSELALLKNEEGAYNDERSRASICPRGKQVAARSPRTHRRGSRETAKKVDGRSPTTS